jgi:hypothetical protein
VRSLPSRHRFWRASIGLPTRVRAWSSTCRRFKRQRRTSSSA